MPPPPPAPAGSSPLARGLQLTLGVVILGVRIIPARAGFTHAHLDACAGAGDHPRSRGVYSSPVGSATRGRGSSPLARGLRALLLVLVAAFRIIPARAGFTAAGGGRRRAAADHPRSRGVYRRGFDSPVRHGGSSPLARGLRRRRPARREARGIIPARAGFTCRRRSRPGGRPDHPRSRGVYLHDPR